MLTQWMPSNSAHASLRAMSSVFGIGCHCLPKTSESASASIKQTLHWIVSVRGSLTLQASTELRYSTYNACNIALSLLALGCDIVDQSETVGTNRNNIFAFSTRGIVERIFNNTKSVSVSVSVHLKKPSKNINVIKLIEILITFAEIHHKVRNVTITPHQRGFKQA